MPGGFRRRNRRDRTEGEARTTERAQLGIVAGQQDDIPVM
jgi:hypothetical protein